MVCVYNSKLYSVDTQIMLSMIEITQFITCSPADASGHVKFWHYTSGKCLQTIDEVRQTLALAINPEGTHVLTAGAEPQIHMYNMETKQKINTMEAT